jgi:enoyl-[acyl-carrier protein] reductase I
MGILAGKRALIVGVATDRSIAWGIAQCMHEQGAELAFSYANDKFRERVEPLAASLGSELLMPLDVQSDEQIDAACARVQQQWGALDILVHAVAFAPREALMDGFTASTTREAFRIAHDGARAWHRPADERTERGDPDPVLPGCRALDPELQRDGTCQGEP